MTELTQQRKEFETGCAHCERNLSTVDTIIISRGIEYCSLECRIVRESLNDHGRPPLVTDHKYISEVCHEKGCQFLVLSRKCGKNMGNDLLVIPCDLPEGHQQPCERNIWPVTEAGRSSLESENAELRKLLGKMLGQTPMVNSAMERCPTCGSTDKGTNHV